MAKCVRFNENPTKTRSGGLTAKHRKTPQEMWATDGGPRDPVRLFEEFLRRHPLEMRTSGRLYLCLNSLPVPPSTDVIVPSSKYATSSSTSLGAAISQASAYSLAHQYSNVQSPITRTNDPAVQQFHNCTVNIQNYFGPQSTNRGTQREYSSKPLKHSIVKRILVFKR